MTHTAPALSRSFPALPGSVPEVRGAVTAFARSVGVTDDTLESVRLAVTEAVTNAVVHAYVECDRVGDIRVEAWIGEELLHVRVSDSGRGMLPRLDSPGLGLGLPLIARCVESLDVESADSGGTSVEMTFRLI